VEVLWDFGTLTETRLRLGQLRLSMRRPDLRGLSNGPHGYGGMMQGFELDEPVGSVDALGSKVEEPMSFSS
jgi:hypothetical protein